MEIIKKKDYLEIDIPYDEINEYIEILEFLEFKKNLNSFKISSKDASELLSEIESGLRNRTKKWLKGYGIEVCD